MATATSSWIKEVAIPMVPYLALKKKVVEICRDFCERTQLWTNNTITAIDIVSGTADYAITSADGNIVKLDDVLVDGAHIDPTVLNEVGLPHGWRDMTSPRPHKYIYDMDDSITLVYTPSESLTGGLEVFATLKPLETATTVPDFLWRDFRKGIADGVRWLLYDTPGFPWSNDQLAEVHRIKYESCRAEAAGKKFTGRNDGDVILGGSFFA